VEPFYTTTKNIRYQMKLEYNKKNVEEAFGNFLTSLGYDWKNIEGMKGTPERVSRMYLDEITKGNYIEPPKITTFVNDGLYDGLIFQGNIDVKSLCSHHFMPFVGKCHIAYIPAPDGRIIGLSKFNRVVEYFARRPQIQENLTMEIHTYLNELTPNNKGIAVMVEANHMCVSMRGVEEESTMMTTKLSGVFLDNKDRSRDEFIQYVNKLK